MRVGTSDAKILQPLIDDMNRTAKSPRDLKFTDVFDFSFVRNTNDELKASG